MSDKPKDYTSTVMRVAGNIASGFAANPSLKLHDLTIAARSVEMARAIVNLVTGDILEAKS